LVIKKILDETDHSLTLFARNATRRIPVTDSSRVKVIDGDYTNNFLVKEAIKGIDLVYLNDMNDEKGVQTVVEAMEEVGVKKLIVASILSIYDEVPGAFGKWNESMVGRAGINLHKRTAATVENSSLDYTILRLTWLYNQKGNNSYQLTQKGEPFQGAQVTREAVAQLILDIIEEPKKYAKKSLGVGEPNTNWAKPSFY
jgi:nucleoside-diphosphate-sugar epimerase